MDANLMKRYVEYVNDLRTNNTSMIMVYDSFRDYLEELVKMKFWNSGIDLAVISDGLTGLCQPLDVMINKPFKDNLRKEWHIWMAGGGAGVTKSENLRHARLSNVCGWVKHAWEGIPDEMVAESFRTCKISTFLDDEITDSEDSDDDDII